ncbi:CCA tRNA nucleotidyltransferase, partial [Prochlorococcus sp. AH-736-B04]|nr:CCA tRNA nucleotidyltransferase [Prochlorococcus sp. AH-736-B04]
MEININDYKIDIASARKEIYPAPGLNPTLTKSTIKEDLKRRDFTINSIAFEVATKKIYDLYGGIPDIKSKKLDLLHSNSISDDPSRLIRCAKYASRLDFNISNNSLKQSQETVRQWPWKSSETHKKMISPPALG